MTDLPAHLSRALHATCGRISEDGEEPTVATVSEITERMGDPPDHKTLEGWLTDLEGRGLLEQGEDGWRVTKDGWRIVNRMPTTDTDDDKDD